MISSEKSKLLYLAKEYQLDKYCSNLASEVKNYRKVMCVPNETEDYALPIMRLKSHLKKLNSYTLLDERREERINTDFEKIFEYLEKRLEKKFGTTIPRVLYTFNLEYSNPKGGIEVGESLYGHKIVVSTDDLGKGGCLLVNGATGSGKTNEAYVLSAGYEAEPDTNNVYIEVKEFLGVFLKQPKGKVKYIEYDKIRFNFLWPFYDIEMNMLWWDALPDRFSFYSLNGTKGRGEFKEVLDKFKNISFDYPCVNELKDFMQFYMKKNARVFTFSKIQVLEGLSRRVNELCDSPIFSGVKKTFDWHQLLNSHSIFLELIDRPNFVTSAFTLMLADSNLFYRREKKRKNAAIDFKKVVYWFDEIKNILSYDLAVANIGIRDYVDRLIQESREFLQFFVFLSQSYSGIHPSVHDATSSYFYFHLSNNRQRNLAFENLSMELYKMGLMGGLPTSFIGLLRIRTIPKAIVVITKKFGDEKKFPSREELNNDNKDFVEGLLKEVVIKKPKDTNAETESNGKENNTSDKKEKNSPFKKLPLPAFKLLLHFWNNSIRQFSTLSTIKKDLKMHNEEIAKARKVLVSTGFSREHEIAISKGGVSTFIEILDPALVWLKEYLDFTGKLESKKKDFDNFKLEGYSGGFVHRLMEYKVGEIGGERGYDSDVERYGLDILKNGERSRTDVVLINLKNNSLIACEVTNTCISRVNVENILLNNMYTRLIAIGKDPKTKEKLIKDFKSWDIKSSKSVDIITMPELENII